MCRWHRFRAGCAALDIARGVIHQPRILFLDEPTIGLDVPNRRAIWRTSPDSEPNSGMTVFLTTHYLEEAIDCGKSHSSVRVALCAKVRRGRWWNNCGHILEVETDQPAQLAEHLEPRLGAALIEGRVCSSAAIAIQSNWVHCRPSWHRRPGSALAAQSQ